MTGPRAGAHGRGMAADGSGQIRPLSGQAAHRQAPPPAPGAPGAIDPAVVRALQSRFGPLQPQALAALAAGRGRDFQRLEFLGDALLELVMHAHAVIVGPACPLCGGRADRFTTDAHLTAVAHERALGTWLTWHPSERRLADLVEACTAAAWWSGRWPAVVRFVADNVHDLDAAQCRALLNGGAQVHPEAPARAREILGAAILEAGASLNAFNRHPDGDEGDLSRMKARLLSTEHVMSRSRESHWVHRRLRTRHFVRDDVERQLADELLGRGIAAAVSIAAVLTG